jgi:hypothetical protein
MSGCETGPLPSIDDLLTGTKIKSAWSVLR